MAEIKIGKWQDDLPDGYDVHDDLRKTREIEDFDFNAVKEAIDNAVEFEPDFPMNPFHLEEDSHTPKVLML